MDKLDISFLLLIGMFLGTVIILSITTEPEEPTMNEIDRTELAKEFMIHSAYGEVRQVSGKGIEKAEIHHISAERAFELADQFIGEAIRQEAAHAQE